MFSKTAELYDLIYRSFKDYAAESARVAELLRSIAPEAESLLDVACGTGEHARHLAELGFAIDGLDIEPGFIEIARRKLPHSRIWCADMADFSVDRRYDVVLCLFSSIGYVLEQDAVVRTLRCFRRHLAPGGVVLVEPWFDPETWKPGTTRVATAETEAMKVVRVSRSGVEGRTSTIEFHYLIATAEEIEHREEYHQLGLFTRQEMLESFERAGFPGVEHDPDGLSGRGLYVARDPGSEARGGGGSP